MVRLFGLGSLLIGQRLFARWVRAVCAALLMALGSQAMAAPMISGMSAVKSDGSLWTWGYLCCYALFPGGSYVDGNFSAVPILRGTGIDIYVPSSPNAAAIMSDGSLWMVGSNMFGQLGTGTVNVPPYSNVPLLIGPGFKSVSLSQGSVFAVKTDGSLWAWGNNVHGLLGDAGNNSANNTYVSSPKQIGSDFAQVVAGYHRTYAIKNNGDLWGWGFDEAGPGWLVNSQTWNSGPDIFGYTMTPIFLDSGYASISTNTLVTFAIKTDGTLWGWGNNGNGLLGDGTASPATTPKQIGTGFAKVSAGYSHALGIKTDGTLWAWGANSGGELGDGTTETSLIPKQIGTGFTHVAAGGSMSLAIKADGSLWVWGNDWDASLGLGLSDQGRIVSTPVQLFASGFSSALSVTTAQRAVSSPQLVIAQLTLTNHQNTSLTFTAYLLEKDGVQYAPDPQDSAAASYAPPVDNTVKVSLAPVTLAANETRVIDVPIVIARPDLTDPAVATPMSVDFGVNTSDSQDIKASLALNVSPRSEPAPPSELQQRLRTGPVADLGAAAAAARSPLAEPGLAQPLLASPTALPSVNGDYWNLWVLTEMNKKPKDDEDRKFYLKLLRFGLQPRDAYAVLYLRAISQLKPEKADKTSWFKLAKGSAQLWAEVKKGQWGLTPDFATPARTIFEGIDSVNALYFLNILELSSNYSAPLVSAMQDNFKAFGFRYTEVTQALCNYVQGVSDAGMVKLPFQGMVAADLAYYMTSNGRWHPKIHVPLFSRVTLTDQGGYSQTMSRFLEDFMVAYVGGSAEACPNNAGQRHWVRIDVHSPILPMVTDSQGRRFGIDAQGTLHEEIPQSYIDPGHPWSMAIPALDGALTIDYALAYPFEYGIDVSGLLDGVETSKHSTQGSAGADFSLKQQAVLTKSPTAVLINMGGTSTTPASQTVTFAPSSPVTFGASPITLSATASSGFTTFTFATSSASSICTVVGSSLTIVGVGTCALTATQAGNANFSSASASANVNITQATQTITRFSPASPVTLGAAPVTLTATGGASGNPVVFATSSAPSICTVSGSVVTFVGAGTCNLTANQAGNSNYSAASQVGASISIVETAVNGACATVAATAFMPTTNLCASGTASAVTAGSPWAWTCTGSGTGHTDASCTAPNQSTPTSTGAVRAVLAPANNWVVDEVNSAGFIPSSGHPKSPPDLLPGTSFPHGLLDLRLQTGTPGSSASITINYPTALPAGTVYWKYGRTASVTTPHWYQYPNAVISADRLSITLTLTDNADGDDAFTTNGVIVDPGGPGLSTLLAQTVTFAPVSPLTVGTAPITLTATASSGLTTFIFDTTSASSICTVSGNTLTVVGVGTCALTATQAGNATFASASASASLVINAASANPTRLLNIATRGKVETVDNVMIAGFIIQGSSPKKVLIRARGPSLAAAPFNVPGTLSDPFLTLYSGATPIDSNDDFAQHANAAQIPADWIPGNAKEAAIVTTLNPGAYTAIVNGVSGSTGVAIVEVFEIDQPGTPLINIATRGPVYTGDNVMIAGLIIQGDAPKTVLITARGPSMAGPPHNVPGTLANPTLSLFSGQTVIATNDNWTEAANAAQIQTAIGAPSNTLESAILVTLQPGAYTAIVSGAGGGTGLAIVEVFAQ